MIESLTFKWGFLYYDLLSVYLYIKEVIMEEIWKDVVGYVGYYEVSNLGRVRSVDREVYNPKGGKALRKGQIMKLRVDQGYVRVSLRKSVKDKSDKRVHRLVTEAFLPNPKNARFVNHIDCDKTNNKLSNLEWVTFQENMDHAKDHNLFNSPKGEKHHKATITADQVREMRKTYKEGNHTQKQIAELFSMNLSTTKHILAGRTWKDVA